MTDKNSYEHTLYTTGECWFLFFIFVFSCWLGGLVLPLLEDWMIHSIIEIHDCWKSIGWFFRYFMIVPAFVAILIKLFRVESKKVDDKAAEQSRLVKDHEQAKAAIESLESQVSSQYRIIAALREEIEALESGNGEADVLEQPSTAETSIDQALDELSGDELE